MGFCPDNAYETFRTAQEGAYAERLPNLHDAMILIETLRLLKDSGEAVDGRWVNRLATLTSQDEFDRFSDACMTAAMETIKKL